MKLATLIASAAALALTAAAHAQPTIDWYTIDGGGGTSSGGSFELSGTIGQPDAGVMSGGSFELSGGFWYPNTGGAGCVVTCDFNQDGGGDTSDVIDLADAIASGSDPYPGSCIDFNQDGGGDTSDVIDMADAIASGTCP